MKKNHIFGLSVALTALLFMAACPVDSEPEPDPEERLCGCDSASEQG